MKNNDYYINRQNAFESNARSYPRKFPFALNKAYGSYLEDVEGNKYLDFLCGAGTLALGHNNPEVNKAMIDLISSEAPLHTLDLITPTKDLFVQTLIENLPAGLKDRAKIQFCSPSGTDAVDAVIKLFKTVTNRRTVIAFSGAYHGMGHGALALTGNLGAKEKVASLMPDVHFFPFPNSYRCPFGIGGETGVDAAIAYFERTLKDPESGITKPAAVILEPIQGEGGVIVAPIKFLKEIRRITRELDIPLIFDEIQCGIGRSGKFFAHEYADVTPDAILVSKAIGGAQPMSLVIYDNKYDVWDAGSHAGTFRGNQLAMAAGTVLMKKVCQKKFLREVKEKGDYLINKLNNLKNEVSIIGDVRGKGLMIGIEFINPNGEKDSLNCFPYSGEISALVQKKCFAKHLIMEKGGRYGSVMRVLCALNVSYKEIDLMFDIFSSAVKEVDSEYR
ncbi:MAG: diaminobutyrate--2-oxoglutarate transaminase family protein [Pleomorphochaeta sp.]